MYLVVIKRITTTTNRTLVVPLFVLSSCSSVWFGFYDQQSSFKNRNQLNPNNNYLVEIPNVYEQQDRSTTERFVTKQNQLMSSTSPNQSCYIFVLAQLWWHKKQLVGFHYTTPPPTTVQQKQQEYTERQQGHQSAITITAEEKKQQLSKTDLSIRYISILVSCLFLLFREFQIFG